MSAEENIHYVPEPAAVELRVVVWAAIASLLLLGGSIASFYQVYQRDVTVKTMPSPQDFPQPQVDTHVMEVEQLHRLATEQNERLKTWRWANDQHTQIQIPI